jgi:hypothetical protein
MYRLLLTLLLLKSSNINNINITLLNTFFNFNIKEMSLATESMFLESKRQWTEHSTPQDTVKDYSHFLKDLAFIFGQEKDEADKCFHVKKQDSANFVVI